MDDKTEEVCGSEGINIALAEHQKALQGWDWKDVARDLHTWAERFILDFNIENIGVPALMIEEPRSRIELGHFRRGRNGFGLIDEIAVSESHIRKNVGSEEYWRILGTLLHEILHQWQHRNGKPPSPNSKNYHNSEYRQKAAGVGLIVDNCGHTFYPKPPTPFWSILEKYGVEIPKVFESVLTERLKRGSSTLRRYVCPCEIKIRSGRLNLRIRCMECNGLFQRND